jgi:DNA repair exonuclease SbcCD ATPase subunit
MDAIAPTADSRRTLWVRFSSILFCAALVGGCERESGEQTRQIESLKGDLEETKRRLSHVQNSLAAKDAELAVTMTTLETTKGGFADLEKALEERNGQLRAIKSELDELEKRDAFVFAEIAALQQQGQTVLARTRYEKFITDFPKSPFVAHATNALAQLSEVQREVRRQIELIDPKRKEREFAKTFNEGYMTLQELAPILKKKSLPQVLALLGRPNQTFNDGTEIGYADRAISSATGSRGMLIISFDSGTVTALRVDYAGRKITP